MERASRHKVESAYLNKTSLQKYLKEVGWLSEKEVIVDWKLEQDKILLIITKTDDKLEE